MNRIKFYGTRGSSSLTSSKYMEFGGATSCIMFKFDNTHIMLDCGSGIANAIEDLKNIDELYLLISHTHLDHISGVATLLQEFKDKKLHIYGKTFNNISIKESINRIMSNDLWPVTADTYKNVTFTEIDKDFEINNIKIKTMVSNHQVGCTLFKFDTDNDSIVTAIDFSHLDGFDKKLIEFSKGCKTLIYDGTFTLDDFKDKANWGHSTPEMGIEIAKQLGCELIITHFGLYDDKFLSSWEKKLQKEYPQIKFARSGNKKDGLSQIVKIGTLLGEEKDNDILLTKVVETSMEITNADGGTLYLLEDEKLEFKVLINKSKETKLVRKNSPIGIPSVDINGKNVCAASAREKRLININDCYNDKNYDFSGAKKYDELNNYLTKSVIVVPLIDEFNDVVGVLQLINAKNKNNEIINFKKEDEDVLLAIANQASMAIVNSSYSEKINDLLYGFVKVMSLGIDERTPYNANHTRNMVKFAERFFDYESKAKGEYDVDLKKRREILMSIWLHDIGKILTPMDIMNKDSRLGELTDVVNNRFERRMLLLKLSLANKEITQEEYNSLEEERNNDLLTIMTINKIGFLSDEFKQKLDVIAAKEYKELDGSLSKIITQDEYNKLCIVKGTLTLEERHVMEGHVSMTQKFLSQLNFPKYYDHIPEYAGNHHEFINGSGYPNHLTGKDLSWPCRLITVLDIFEALTAKDRPYKKAFTPEQSFAILNEMADKGQLDKDIISEFQKSNSWESNN